MEMKFDKKDMEEERKRILEERVKHKKFIAEFYKTKNGTNWIPVNEESLLKEKFSFLFSREELKSKRKLTKAQRLKFVNSWIDFMQKNPNSVWSKQHADFVNMVYTKYEKK